MRYPVLFAVGTAGVLLGCDSLSGALSAHEDVVAKAGSQELTVERLATLLGNSQAPLRKDIAKTVADVWVDYQLIALAAAKNDSLDDPKLIDDAMWSAISGAKIRKFYDQVSKSWSRGDSTKDESLYNSGEILAARHILISTPQGASPADVEAARRKAESLRSQATPANFESLAKKNSEEPNAAQTGGALPFFTTGQMVPQFEQAVRALKPGEISPVVRTQFGFHVIYRPSYREIAAQFAPAARSRALQVSESTYMAAAESGAKVDVKKSAISTVRAVAANLDAHRDDKTVIASTKYGDFTAADLARWVAAVPKSAQLRTQIAQAPDTLMPNFIRNVIRNEIVSNQADSAKIQVDSAELNEMRRAFRATLQNAWAGLGVQPRTLADSAKSEADRVRLATARVESYFEKLLSQQAQFVEVPPPLEFAVRKKYDYKINEAGIDRAVERALKVRASSDSARTAGQPESSIPLPDSGSREPGTGSR
jgi:parvulin-like peptidyl-prolyl isomerase